jgi:hypothetical protein
MEVTPGMLRNRFCPISDASSLNLEQGRDYLLIQVSRALTIACDLWNNIICLEFVQCLIYSETRLFGWSIFRNVVVYEKLDTGPNFFITKPTRYNSLPNLLRHETLHIFGSSSAHHQEFYSLYTRQLSSRTRIPSWSCSKAVYKPVWYIPLPSVQWMSSWWWAEQLPKTCRVSCRSKLGKLVHLVGFIIKKFVTMQHGHMNVQNWTKYKEIRPFHCHYLLSVCAGVSRHFFFTEEALRTHLNLFSLLRNIHGDWSYGCTPSRLNVF